METKGLQTICEALHKVMESVGYVQKGSVNEFHRYKYASEGDLLKTLRPAMVEAGLMLIPSQTEHSAIDDYGNVTVEMEYTLCHASGAVWPEKIKAIGCGNDKNSKGGVGDKGLYKAITGANKYLLFKLFQIETGDDPEATDNGDTATKETKQAKRPTPHENNGNGGAQARYEQNVEEVFGQHKAKEDGLRAGNGTGPSQKQINMIRMKCNKLGIDDIQLEELANTLAGESVGLLTKGGASKVIDHLMAKEDEMKGKKEDEIPF